MFGSKTKAQTMKCKCCKESIADGASICKHCGAHQGRLLRVLSQFGSAEIVVSTILLVITILQFWAASREKSEASAALARAEHAERLSIEAQKRIAAHEEIVKAIRTELEHAENLAEFSDLTFRAENGERVALVKLKERSQDNDWVVTTVAEKNLSRILARFKDMEISDPAVAARINGIHFMDNKDAVERYLTSPQYETRATAVNTVLFLRLNCLIPKVIAIGASDMDLHVVQVACNTLNKLLLKPDMNWQFDEQGHAGMQPLSIYDFAFLSQQTQERLLQIWENRKDKLLSVKPKYWRHENGGKMVLTDPEERKQSEMKAEQGAAPLPSAPEGHSEGAR